MSTEAAVALSDASLPAEAGGQRPAGDVNLDVVLDIPVTLSLEVGRSPISIRNLLSLNQGSDRISEGRQLSQPPVVQTGHWPRSRPVISSRNQAQP